MAQIHVAPIHTPEQVAEILDKALAIVADVELSDDLRSLAFSKAVDLLAARHVFASQPQALALDPRFLGRQ